MIVWSRLRIQISMLISLFFTRTQLTVSDHVDSTHLREHLHERGLKESSTPLWFREHWRPARSCNFLLGLDRCHNLVEFLLDPVFIATIVMETAKLAEC
jgi:hypothetical protein